MVLLTSAQIERLRGVVDRNGELRPAPNADLQTQVRDYLAAVQAALASEGDDELRVTAPETLPVEQQSPIGVEDSAGSQVDPATSADVGNVEQAQQTANDRLGNADAVLADKIQPSTSGETLPAHSVDEGSEVLLLADPANAGPVYVGPPGSPTVPLSKGNGVTFGVSSTDALAAKASSSGDVLHIMGEA